MFLYTKEYTKNFPKGTNKAWIIIIIIDINIMSEGLKAAFWQSNLALDSELL